MQRGLMQFEANAGPDQPAQMSRLIGACIVHLQDPVETVVYVDKQRIVRSDCMEAHADLDLHVSCQQIA